ncbi:MAG: tetratricopeptide repeat protein [Gammaproteobacteria bacterium]|nr:tetratricopeptide repeat protein [Gammaproteobacteria bacterium]
MNQTTIEAQLNKLLVHIQQGQVEAACNIASDLSKKYPKIDNIWYFWGIALAMMGNAEESEKRFKQCLTLNSKHFQCYNNLGTLYEQQERYDQAQRQFEKAISLNPHYAIANYNLGNCHFRVKDWSGAISCYELALQGDPNYVKALNNLALVYINISIPEKAMEYLEIALKLAPNDVEVLLNLGQANYLLGKDVEAENYYTQLSHIAPVLPQLHNNLALLYQWRQEFDKAERSFRRAAEVDANFIEAESNLSNLFLLQGRFKEGWYYNLFRPSIRDSDIKYSNELPQNLTGKAILIRQDQGLGDELIFMRYVETLKNLGAKVSYYCESKLKNILERTGIFLEVISHSNQKEYDATISVADLPYLLGKHTGNYTIPQPLSLEPRHELVEHLKTLLQALGPAPYIGLTWRAGVKGFNTLYKNISFQDLKILLGKHEGTLISLQRHPDFNETEELSNVLGCPLHDYSYVNDDLELSLALLSILDRYVAVSNTNTHLRESLRKPSVTLVSYPPDWRWLAQGETSPWAPNSLIIRQNKNGSWTTQQQKANPALAS